MHQFGGFSIADPKEMKLFGRMIQAFLIGPGQAIIPSTPVRPPAKDLPVRPPAKANPFHDAYELPEDPFQDA